MEDFDYDLKAVGKSHILYLMNNMVRMTHKRFFHGSNDININNVGSITFNKAGFFQGSIRFRCTGDNILDLHAIFFRRKHNEEFILMRNEIEKRMKNHN
jgi:hypothetical protein